MDFQLEHAVDHLRRTPVVLQSMLGGLPDPWVELNYGPDTFSPFDVVGHLIHGERADWIPRARHLLAHGGAVPFEPFDRYAMYEASRGLTMATLLETFAALREENVVALEAMKLTPETLARPGLHPQLGAVTLEQLLATWVVHDFHHTAQIAKGMSYRYRDRVGAWRAYLGIIPGG